MSDIIIAVINLFGGLALFLYGMSIMGNSLEKIAGGKMQKILEKITSNIFLGVLFGMVVTALIQSSSATTVMVVGLVNAGIFKLRQAVGVIMGANIGTTVTAQILRLADLDSSSNEILKFMSPKVIAPLIAIVGILLFMVASSAKKKTVGQILLGFGILFTGMFAMEGSISQYKDSPLFQEIFATLTNPIFGVIAGCLVTVLIQSSSASIGILQALSTTGRITFSAAFPIIMGQNIGTCITPILSSIGANRNAKRAAMVHLYFNLIGTTLFLVAIYGAYWLVPNIFPFWNETMGRGEIANFHAMFNIITTLVLIPFARWLEKLAIWTVKIKKDADADAEDSGDALAALDHRFISTPSIAIAQSKKLLLYMAKLTQKNYRDSISVLGNYDKKLVSKIQSREDDIDIIEDRLSNYIVQLPVKELSDSESHDVTEILQLINEFERIGDYSINIVEKSEYLVEKKSAFSEKGVQEIATISSAVSEILAMSIDGLTTRDKTTVMMIEPLEETIDEMEEKLKSMHIERLKEGKCSIDAGVVFLEVLTYLERISDHCSNVAVSIVANEKKVGHFESHEYIKKLHQGNSEQYKACFEQYKNKYLLKIKAD